MTNNIKDFEEYYTHKTKEKRNAYYREYAERYLENPKSVKWNWAAVFLSFSWLIYRKAYRALAYSIPILVLIDRLLAKIPGLTGGIIQILWGIMLVVLSGLYGNNIYFWDIKQRIAKNSQAKGTNGFWRALLIHLVIILVLFLVVIALAVIAGLIAKIVG